MKSTQEELFLEEIKKGSENALKELYGAYWEHCYEWTKKHFTPSENLFEDIYQDSVIALYEAAIDGKLDHIQCSLKTYLFAICRNKLLSNLKLQKRQDEQVDEVQLYLREWMEPEEDLQDEVELIKRMIKDTDEPCKSILTLFYYHNKSNDEIAEVLGYTSKNVIKVQKHRCLSYLKEKVFKQWKKN